MLIVDTGSVNPQFNLAAEEYLFRNRIDDLFILYVNGPSVIIGKHQNAYEEINLKYLRDNNVPLLRRISGGGSVYHDEGNLNFTFIRNSSEGRKVDFSKYIEPVISFFRECGISPEVGDKNEILSDGLKFSGNAEHISKNRVLHHGTILFSSTLKHLREALAKGAGEYISKAVQSNRASVGNLEKMLPDIAGVTDLKKRIFQYIESLNKEATRYIFNDADLSEINRLIEEKYNKWDWNYGYGPDYVFKNTIETGTILFSIELSVKSGKIIDSKITSDTDLRVLEQSLTGVRHCFEDVGEIISGHFGDMDDSIIYKFFK
ncbi:MAG: lipoate--protein ligase [Bacteroidales bacterium]|nr:lipoate--protein ligase [Bacteroidales bacterium]